MKLNFTINVIPRTKKNNMQPRLSRAGKFLGLQQSEAYRRFEKECLWLIPQSVRIGITHPINIKAIYYMDRDYISDESKAKVDLLNLHGALHDVLSLAGVIKDDEFRIVKGTDGSDVRIDKNNPRIEVEITEVPV